MKLNSFSFYSVWVSLRSDRTRQPHTVCSSGLINWEDFSHLWTKSSWVQSVTGNSDQVMCLTSQVTTACGTSMQPSPGSAGTSGRSEGTRTTSPSLANQPAPPASVSRSENKHCGTESSERHLKNTQLHEFRSESTCSGPCCTLFTITDRRIKTKTKETQITLMAVCPVLCIIS